ncbi:hypothetical protein [Streptomyces peucetius]|nr:hypothetical protein CGZ69_10375 [Streptomyces peucetius subsp. caesius ATCC 27952]
MTEGSDERAGAATSAGRGDGSAASRSSWLRRALRSRTVRAAAATGIVGVLLGAGTVAWRTDTLPLLKPAPCWDSLDDTTLAGLFGDRRLEVEEQQLRPDPGDFVDRTLGSCRITAYEVDSAGLQTTLRVHRLDGLFGRDSRLWPADHLTSRMVELGDGLPGQVSGTRAWLALPESCTGKAGDNTGAMVVDLATGTAFSDRSFAEEYRTANARAVVQAANGVMRDLGCDGTYDLPGRLRAMPERQDIASGDLCGVKGLALSAGLGKTLEVMGVGGGDGTARVCEVGQDKDSFELRLLTVTAPGLSAVYSVDLLGGGTRIKGTKGSGVLTTDRALYQAKCPTGDVVFLIEQDRTGDQAVHHELLPAYVAAEADRIGCGPEKVELPAA